MTVDLTKPDQVEAVARLETALKLIAGSHWERWGIDQTDIEELPDLSAEEAMKVARDALSYDDDQPVAQAAIAAMQPAPVVTDEMVQTVLRVFNHGIVREPDAKNPRGYTDKFKPALMMRRALEAALGAKP